jgi:hypothetical protein
MAKYTQSPDLVKKKPTAYENFMGLDGYSDIRSLDTGNNQYLISLRNGFCDQRGQVVRDPGGVKIQGDHPVIDVEFYTPTKVCYAERDGKAVNLQSEEGHEQTEAFSRSALVSSTVFNRRVHFFAEAEASWIYDGTNFGTNTSPSLNLLRPAFGTTVGRRLAVAGARGRETEIHFSRVDDHRIFPEDEAEGEASVLRAGVLDIANQLDRAEGITGISKFEQSRLAVFTSERTLIYLIDPNIDLWALDDKAAINIGCVSHRTIVRAGTDILFCSRSGVHFLRRSVANGITIESNSMSKPIEILYRSLVASVEDEAEISACYDPDMRQYHIFFPQPGEQLAKRLTVTIRENEDENPPAWSDADFLNSRCGAFLGGRLVYGTSGGIYDIQKIEVGPDDVDNLISPDLYVKTPMLWHGSFVDEKQVKEIILQAAGSGLLRCNVYDDEGALIYDFSVEVDESPDDNFYPDVPLSQEYQIPLNLRYRGAQYEFMVEGDGLCRIIGFAINVKDK